MKKLLISQFGKKTEQIAYKAQDYLEKKSGTDISLGNISGMGVEMVKILEPFEKYVIISKYINSRIVYVSDILTAMFAQKKASQKDFNELIGLTIILNETETSATQVLLSTPQCWLGPKDYYFKRSTDPCRDLSKESFSKIISRIEGIQKTVESMKSTVEVPLAWDNHLRSVMMKLDMYSADVLEEKERKKWSAIKQYIQSKRIL